MPKVQEIEKAMRWGVLALIVGSPCFGLWWWIFSTYVSFTDMEGCGMADVRLNHKRLDTVPGRSAVGRVRAGTYRFSALLKGERFETDIQIFSGGEQFMSVRCHPPSVSQ